MRFRLDPPEDDAVEWDPHEPPADLRDDVRYWSEAFGELPRAPDLTVVLTWSIVDLPVEGPNVVAVVLADEGSRRPSYAPRIGGLFKCYGDRPRLSTPSAGKLGIAVMLQELRRAAAALRDPRGGPPAHPVPLGLVRPLDVDVRPMPDRDIAVAFMGSVEEDHRRLPSAKTISRRAMLEALPDGTHVRTTSSFGASLQAGADVYADELGRTKVLLVPRGGSVETFRFYEGMLAGCVVVTEPLPGSGSTRARLRWSFAVGGRFRTSSSGCARIRSSCSNARRHHSTGGTRGCPRGRPGATWRSA